MKLLEFLFKDIPIAVTSVIGLATTILIVFTQIPSLNYIPKMFVQWIVLPWIFGH